MAAHLRPRVQTTTNRKGRSEASWLKPAAGKCSGLLGGGLVEDRKSRLALQEDVEICVVLAEAW